MTNCTAGEQVTNLLREKILKGEIPDNVELTQTWIADQLGVSRMPIREALSRLEFEGFIERLDNRHTRTIGVSGKLMRSRLCFLASLESEVAISFSERHDMQLKIRYLAECCEGKKCKNNEFTFHETLFQLVNDRFYHQIFKNIAKPSMEVFLNDKISSVESFQLLKDIVINIKSKNRDLIRLSIERYYEMIEINMRIEK